MWSMCFHSVVFALVFGLSEFVNWLFQSRFLVPCTSAVFLDLFPIGSKPEVWGAPISYAVVGVPGMELESLAPPGGSGTR